ncbi:MAG TPA: hypothetical protein VGE98_09675 [Thermoanaerobaculia bacterium]
MSLAIRLDTPTAGSGAAVTAPRRYLVVALCGIGPHSQPACDEFLPWLGDLGVRRVTLRLAACGCGAAELGERPSFRRWLQAKADAGHAIVPTDPPPAAGPKAAVLDLSSSTFGRRTLSCLRARLRFSLSRSAPLLRLSLRPDDLYDPALRGTVAALVRRSLRDRAMVTEEELA